MRSRIRAFLLYMNWLAENEIASEGDTHDKRFFLLCNFQYRVTTWIWRRAFLLELQKNIGWT